MKEKLLTKKEEKEVKKKLRHILYERAKRHGTNFKKEFKKQLVVAVSAALGFLMAFSWREPITDLVKLIAARAGASENMLFYNVISAIILTIVAVLVLILISRWSSGEN